MQNTYHPQTGKLIAKIAENLPSEMTSDVMQGWIQNPKALQKFLRGLCPPNEHNAPLTCSVWKTVKIGTHKNVDALRQDLLAKGFRIGDWANDILNKVVVEKVETELDLVVLSVAELGLKDGAYYKDIRAKAKELGLEECPAEVGPQLRLQYADQAFGEWVAIAMEPIRGSDGHLHVFDVGHREDGHWFDGFYGSPGDFWTAGRLLVFVQPSNCK